MSAGVILWFNRSQGYGFIAMIDGTQVYFHEASIRDQGNIALASGSPVEFDVLRTSMGLEATNVRSSAAICV